MPQSGPVYNFEMNFLTAEAICPPLGGFRLYDGARVTFFFTPKGLAMRIRHPKEEEALRLSRELLDDNQVRSIIFGSTDVKF
jgi:hypothetical protein